RHGHSAGLEVLSGHFLHQSRSLDVLRRRKETGLKVFERIECLKRYQSLVERHQSGPGIRRVFSLKRNWRDSHCFYFIAKRCKLTPSIRHLPAVVAEEFAVVPRHPYSEIAGHRVMLTLICGVGEQTRDERLSPRLMALSVSGRIQRFVQRIE